MLLATDKWFPYSANDNVCVCVCDSMANDNVAAVPTSLRTLPLSQIPSGRMERFLAPGFSTPSDLPVKVNDAGLFGQWVVLPRKFDAEG